MQFRSHSSLLNRPKGRKLPVASLLVLACLFQGIAYGNPLEPEAKFACHVNLNALRETRLGQSLIHETCRMTQEELGSAEDPQAKIAKTLGFNPFEEVQSVTVRSDSLEDPTGIQIQLNVGKTTGNLEGLMLTAPGYESEELNGYTIHSSDLERNRAYVSIHTAKDGNKSIFATLDQPKLMKTLDAISNDNPKTTIDGQMDPSAILHLHIHDLPTELRESIEAGNPMRNIVQFVSAIDLVVIESQQNFELSLNITAISDSKATQLDQLARGALAYLELIEDQKRDDEEFKTLMTIMESVDFGSEGKTFSATATISEDFVLEFLRKEAQLEFSVYEEDTAK
ncbi:MAG: hypothetical protein AAF483_17890 [Planctomycetota bacterium]